MSQKAIVRAKPSIAVDSPITARAPFGKQITNLSLNPAGQKLRYNGKELQTQNLGGRQLDWYDYGARFYDPTLGRWHSVDPLAEVNRRWSPYRYAYNNPLKFIDPDGMLEDNYDIYENGNIDVVRTEDITNTYTYHKNDGTNVDLGTYSKNDNGYVDLCNGGNTGSGKGWEKTNSNAKNYLNGDVAAAFLGGAFKFSSKNNNTSVEVTQFTTSSGAHSGKDSYKGGAIDVKYVDSSGAAIPSTTSASFDQEKNQILVNTFISFGFKNAPGGFNVLTEDANKQAALENTKYVDVSPNEHKSHFHLQKYDYTHIKTITFP